MHSPLLTDDLLKFIAEHRNDNTEQLRLKWHGKNPGFDIDFALTQIECRRRCRIKLSRFTADERFLFPTVVASEQASNQSVASYHAETFAQSGSLLDMTAGLGIDAFTFSKKGMKVAAFELDEFKADVLRHNSEIIGLKDFKTVSGDSVEALNNNNESYDIIYIDPARRKGNNERAYNFKDCQPDILTLQNDLLERCEKLLIKGSPLLDVTQTVRDIREIKSIHVVSVENECKEVLIEAGKNMNAIKYVAVDLNKDGKIISKLEFLGNDTGKACDYSCEFTPGLYLYEPNASVMKLAPWAILSDRYPGLKKLGKDSHLFISDSRFDDFPGRVLKIDKTINKKDRKTLKGFPANVVTRNYPLSADNLRKKLGVREGTDSFIYGTRIGKDPILLLCERCRNDDNQNR